MLAAIGELNKNWQMLIAKSDRRGNHPYATLWLLRCSDRDCGLEYEANSCDFHSRRCPRDGGKPSSGTTGADDSGTIVPHAWSAASGRRSGPS